MGRSDPRTPGVISSQDWPGKPHDAGRTRLGPSQYIGSQQRRDSSTTISINPRLSPAFVWRVTSGGRLDGSWIDYQRKRAWRRLTVL